MAVTLRRMNEADLNAVAGLHAASWRAAYADVLSAEYLAGPVEIERTAAWAARAPELSNGRAVGWIAEAGEQSLAGFGYVIVHNDPVYGHLLDNLHVAPGRQSKGVGRQLLGALGAELAPRGLTEGVYLWVYASNVRAQAFYQRCGATCMEEVERLTVEGRPVIAYRYGWPSVGALQTGVSSG